LTPWAAAAGATITATIDTDEHVETPAPHRHIHGVIPDHVKFQLALPDHWNGELAVFSRGFSGTELTTGSFEPAALAKGYAFAASDEGWNRYTIAQRPQDSYYESRQALLDLTLYAKQLILAYYHREPSRTLMMGGSNGGHHTKWMVESFPDLYDGGIAGYGYMAQESQWGSVATVLRNYDIIAPRIDDIIAKRKSDPAWDPARSPLAPPLTAPQLQALQNIYHIPVTLQSGFQLDVGRWPGSEAQWKSQYHGLLGYLHDSMPRFDETFHPGGGPLTDNQLKLWDPAQSPKYIRQELAKLDLTGDLQRPIIAMHGAADPIISPGEEVGYRALVESRLGRKGAEQVLALYFIPGMGHGGAEYNHLVGAQLDALERWIDYRESGGKRGAPPPATLGGYPRSLGGVPGK
jgi:hypothetical protein